MSLTIEQNIVLLLWIFFSLCIGEFAKQKGRNFFIHTALSIIITPYLGFVITSLLCIDEDDIPKERNGRKK